MPSKLKLSHRLLNYVADRLKKPRAPADPLHPRILVIRRNRMGDMIYTLPLLHTLRRHHPKAHIAVACDPAGMPIAQACASLNEVIVLTPGWNPWQALLANASQLQDYDWVIAAKGGFDKRLALLVRLTNAPVRVGFKSKTGEKSVCFTDHVDLPPPGSDEHQIETLMRLLQPLGILQSTQMTVDLSIKIPDESRELASRFLDANPSASNRRLLLINLSSTSPLKFREEDFIALGSRILGSTELVIGLVGAPTDQQKAHEIAICMASRRIVAIETPNPLDLAALLEHATMLLTPEGGAAHLAAAVNTPALVLWSEGPFEKWYSRGKNHSFIRADPGEKTIPVERVWQALQPFLPGKKQDDFEQQWADMMQLPPPDLT